MIAIFQSVHNFPFAISALEETELPSKKLFAFSLPQKIPRLAHLEIAE